MKGTVKFEEVFGIVHNRVTYIHHACMCDLIHSSEQNPARYRKFKIVGRGFVCDPCMHVNNQKSAILEVNSASFCIYVVAI